jgi:hypothetical protein
VLLPFLVDLQVRTYDRVYLRNRAREVVIDNLMVERGAKLELQGHTRHASRNRILVFGLPVPQPR